MTAVEWYAEEFSENLEEYYNIKIKSLTLLARAKIMEKQQIIDAYLEGMGHYGDENSTSQSEQYYNEKFK